MSSSDPLYRHCRSLAGVTEDIKWGDNLVFSVGGKMFAVFDCPAGEPHRRSLPGGCGWPSWGGWATRRPGSG